VVSADEGEGKKRDAMEEPRRIWKNERLFIGSLSCLGIAAKAFHKGAFRSDD
jgi:hypothetical protein